MGKTIGYFREWLTKPIPYKKKLSMDGVGKITYASEVNLDCYVHGMLTKVVNDKAEEVVSTEQIYLDGENETVQDIDFGDVFDRGTIVKSKWRPVKSIDRFYDEDGILDLVVIYL